MILKNQRIKLRLFNLFAAFFCFGSLAFAILYLQNVLWLEPCPYCKLQRVIFFILGMLFLLLAIMNPRRWLSRFGALWISIVSGLGIYVAAKHVFIQMNPAIDNTISCQATTNSITEVLNIQVIREILSARGDCSVIDWTILGLSIPMLSLLAYCVLGLVGTIVNYVGSKD